MTFFDKPTHEDKFGFKPYVKGIDELIRNTKAEDLPVTIGIYGVWGSGKTSFMLQLRDCLETEADDVSLPLATIWFDAWKYDYTHDVRSALIYKILFDIEREAAGDIKTKIGETINRAVELTKGIVEQTSISACIPGNISMNLPATHDATTRINEYRNFQTTVDKFSDDFAEAINAFLESKRKVDKEKLVVFIDNLDRCLPENVIVILEVLKLFLDDSPCVFVIGVDRAAVERAFQAHYRTDIGVSGRQYLDKIVQYPLDLPPADQAKLAVHFEELLKSKSVLDDKCRYIMNLAAVGNPRIYLRLLSGWELTWALATQVNERLTQGKNLYLLMLVTVMHIRFPKLYGLSQRNPNGLRVLAELCLQTKTKQVAEFENIFLKSDSYEYYEFWKNEAIRSFLSGLFPVVAENPSQLFYSQELLKAAFNLSASIG